MLGQDARDRADQRQAEYDRAKQAPLGITTSPGSIAANRFPAYVDLVRRQLARDYPADALQGAGLSVMTGMSPSAQAYAEGAVTRTLKSLESQAPSAAAGRPGGDRRRTTAKSSPWSAAATFAMPGFNRAVEAQRPVGSLLKPFVYLLALAQPDN